MNIHIYPSVFANETRILKIVRSLKHRQVFSDILIVALGKEGLPKHEVIEEGIEVIRVTPLFGANLSGMLGKVIKVIGWYLAVLFALRGRKVVCFNCHSLPVLPLSVLIKAWKRCVLVYDSHELETETATSRGLRKRMGKLLEKTLIRFCDAVSVVNTSIANWYKEQYHLNEVHVVKNVPYRRAAKTTRTGLLRQAIALDDKELLFIYQGLLSHGRGLEVLLETFAGLPRDRHLVFMGYGELEGLIKEKASTHANIHFMSAVPPELIQDYTVDADIGISLIENVCLSYYLCLPNKLFEYSACGVPAIVSDFPEMGRFIDEFESGWKIPPSVSALRDLILSLTPEDIAVKRLNTHRTQQQFCWEEEEAPLLYMYRSLGLLPHPAP